MKPVEIAIADNHRMFREALISLIQYSYSEDAKFQVVLEAAHPPELFAKLDNLVSIPDVLLLDLNMHDTEDGHPHYRDLDGLDVLEKLRSNPIYDRMGIIILTMYQSEYLMAVCMRAGANAYILKNADQDELKEAIITVSNHERYFNQAVANALVDHQRVPDHKIFDEPSPRELEVLKLLAEGSTNQQIGEKLFISPKTVDGHRTNLLAKFQVNNVAALIAKAFKAGYLKVS